MAFTLNETVEMVIFFSIALLLLTALAMLAFNERLTGGAKVFWLLFIWFVPVIGAIIFVAKFCNNSRDLPTEEP